MTQIQRLMRLHRLYREPAGEHGSNEGGTGSGEGAGEGTGASDGTGSAEDGKGEGDDDGKAAGTPEGDGKGDAGKKPSDAEAKLLKDVMKQKGRVEEVLRELEAAKAALKNYEGIDPAKARELLSAEEEAQRKAAEARGEYDRLVAQMADRHKSDMAAAQAQMSTISGENAALKQQIAELTVGNAFVSSPFVANDLTLTPTKARVIYGAHFGFQDGKVVGYDKPAGASERTVLVNATGEPLSFDEALRVLVDKDPERDQLIRSKAKPGAGSSTTNKGAKTAAAAVDAARAAKLSGAEKIAAGLKALAKG